MDDDAIELRKRVEQLEQIAASQQETIEELENQSLLGSWGRRGVLGGIAAALGVASASGSAAAGVGDVGTPSERVDIFGDQADVNALEATKIASGLTWQNVSGNRSIDSQETNNSGSDILVSVGIQSGADTNAIIYDLRVDGVRINTVDDTFDIGQSDFMIGRVPDGSTYEVSGQTTSDSSIKTWAELRP